MSLELSGQWLSSKYYPYGDVQAIEIRSSMLFGEVVWACAIPSLNYICGGFSGPFEALAHALQYAKEHS